jgi:hypothetical protein
MQYNGFKKYALIALLCFVAFTGNSQLKPLSIEHGESTTFKFRLFNNLVLLKGSLNGSDTLTLILDTGVKNSIILNKSIGDKLGLSYSRSVNLLGTGSDQIISALVVDSTHLNLYGVSGSIKTLLVLEEDYLQIRESFGADVHGILGYDIFRRFIVRIDYVNHQITFYYPSAFKESRWFTRIPMDIINGKPYIDVQVKRDKFNGYTTKLLLDLGASHSALFELETHDSLALPDKHISCNLGRGLGGDIAGYKARVKYLAIDEFHIEDAIVSYTHPYIHIKDSSDIYRHGTVGAEIFTRFTIIIDYFNKAVYLRKNSFFKSKFEYNMSGLDLMAKGKNLNLFYISNVAKDSPSDQAGALPGDLILSINGINTLQYDIDELQRLFHSRNKRWIRIQALRNNQILEYKFRLKREI